MLQFPRRILCTSLINTETTNIQAQQEEQLQMVVLYGLLTIHSDLQHNTV